MTGRVLVLGLGNPDRGDDGIGAAVVQRLAGRVPGDVRLAIVGGDLLSAIDDWSGCDAVICIDAAARLTAPGRIHRIDLGTETLPPDFACASSHEFGLAESIALARALDVAPAQIIIYAVEGGCFSTGAALTADVAAACGRVADLVLDEVVRLRQQPGQAAHG